MGNGFLKMKKQAKLLQDQYAQMQEDLKNKEVEGTSGNGLVILKLNGNKELIDLKIKPECIDKEDKEGLEDLILLAHKNALEKLKNNIDLPFSF